MREELRIELSELCEGNPGVRKLMLHFSTSEDVAFTSISDLAAIVGKDPTDSAVREVADELLRYFSDQLDLGNPRTRANLFETFRAVRNSRRTFEEEVAVRRVRFLKYPLGALVRATGLHHRFWSLIYP